MIEGVLHQQYTCPIPTIAAKNYESPFTSFLKPRIDDSFDERLSDEGNDMKKSLTALAAIGTMMITAPAYAGQIAIQYSDLNLTTEAGKQQLDRRIDNAARQICGTDQITGTRIRNSSTQKCYKDVKQQAARQVARASQDQRRSG